MSIILECRPGEGGDDAKEFAQELLHALLAHARFRQETAVQISLPDAQTQVYRLEGPRSYWQRFAGTHRIQRVPKNDKRGRRHTSTATIAILAEQRCGAVTLDDADLEVTHYKGSGPGGQHRNKNATAVRIKHLPTGYITTAEDSKSQWTNWQQARAKMTALLQADQDKAAQEKLRYQRSDQIITDRAAKSFTHNTQRNCVLDHETGQRWSLTEWQKGKID